MRKSKVASTEDKIMENCLRWVGHGYVEIQMQCPKKEIIQLGE